MSHGVLDTMGENTNRLRQLCLQIAHNLNEEAKKDTCKINKNKKILGVT